MIRRFLQVMDWPNVGRGLLIVAGYAAGWAFVLGLAVFLGLVARAMVTR